MIVYASGGKESFTGKRVAISGSGNVAQYAALKVIELGGIVVSLSDSKGSIVATDEKGITEDEIAFIAQLKVDRKQLTEIANSENHKDRFKYVEGARPWTHVGKVDVALPSATQNEVSGEEAKALIEAGAKFIAEGSNMGCSLEAIEIFENDRKTKKGDAIWYGPGKSCLFLFFILACIFCKISFFFFSFSLPTKRRDLRKNLWFVVPGTVCSSITCAVVVKIIPDMSTSIIAVVSPEMMEQRLIFSPQARLQTLVVSPCLDWRWPKTRSAPPGRSRKWITS